MASVASCWRRPRVRRCFVRVKPWRRFDRSLCRVFLQTSHFGVNRWKGYSREERNARSCRRVLFDFLYIYLCIIHTCYREVFQTFSQSHLFTPTEKTILLHVMSWIHTLALTWYRLFKSIFLCFRWLWFLGCFGWFVCFVLLLFWSPCSGQCSSLSWEWYNHKRAIWSWRWMFNRWTSHTYSTPFLLCLALFPTYISYL